MFIVVLHRVSHIKSMEEDDCGRDGVLRPVKRRM